MPFCPECKCEYVNGIEKCPDCDAELVWALPTEFPPDKRADIWISEETVTVFTARSSMEAEIVRGVLESAGIPTYVGPGLNRWVMGETRFADLGSPDIKVLASQAEDAKTAIKAAMEAGSDMPEEV